MSVYDYQIASTFGVLDGDALGNGRALDAHSARVMARQHNRNLAKRQILYNKQWPQVARTLDDLSMYDAEWLAPLLWEPFLPPITVRKKPGATRADVHLRVRGEAGTRVDFRVATRARDDAGAQMVTASFSGDWEYLEIEVEVAPGDSETLTLLAKSRTEGALLETSTFGGPASGTVTASDIIRERTFIRPGATWITGPSSLAGAGHYLRYLDQTRIVAQALIEAVEINFTYGPAIEHQPIQHYRDVRAIAARGDLDFEIRAGTPFALSQVLVLLQERDL